MGNCCSAVSSDESFSKRSANHRCLSISIDDPDAINRGCYSLAPSGPITVLRDPKDAADLLRRYQLGDELGRGEFGVTRRCTDSETGEALACKSISKRKLRSTVDIADVQLEVEIMRTLPHHPNVVWLRDAFEDREAVHLVMEACNDGELFDRIVARGHYTERVAATVMKTIMEVVQLYVSDESGQIPVLVKNRAAEILFGNVTAENVYRCYQDEQRNQIPFRKSDRELHNSKPSNASGPKASENAGLIHGNQQLRHSMQTESKSERKKLNFYHIWLILVKSLLQQNKNSPFRFEIAVDKEKDLDKDRFELVSVTMPCYRTEGSLLNKPCNK